MCTWVAWMLEGSHLNLNRKHDGSWLCLFSVQATYVFSQKCLLRLLVLKKK